MFSGDSKGLKKILNLAGYDYSHKDDGNNWWICSIKGGRNVLLFSYQVLSLFNRNTQFFEMFQNVFKSL